MTVSCVLFATVYCTCLQSYHHPLVSSRCQLRGQQISQTARCRAEIPTFTENHSSWLKRSEEGKFFAVLLSGKAQVAKEDAPMSEAVGSLDTEMPLWCKLCCFKEVAAIMAIALKAYQTIDMARTSTVLKCIRLFFYAAILTAAGGAGFPARCHRATSQKLRLAILFRMVFSQILQKNPLGALR